MFKVVTEDMKSLGLRGHKNIVTYPVGQILRHENPIEGKCDEGGYWILPTLPKARTLQKYMKRRHKTRTRIFVVNFDNILFHNSYRTKVGTIQLIEEVF